MAVQVDIRPLSDADLIEMAERMRPVDRLEYDAMMGDRPVVDGLRAMVAKSRSGWAAFADGNLVCIYGVLSQTILSTEAAPWLLATDAIEKKPVRMAFARGSRAEAARLLTGYRLFRNFVFAGNVETIRWLKWLGFRFRSDIYPVNGLDFLLFEMERDVARFGENVRRAPASASAGRGDSKSMQGRSRGERCGEALAG